MSKAENVPPSPQNKQNNKRGQSVNRHNLSAQQRRAKTRRRGKGERGGGQTTAVSLRFSEYNFETRQSMKHLRTLIGWGGEGTTDGRKKGERGERR